MAEQAIDMRSFFSNFRHHRTAVAAAVLLGAGAGAGLVVAMPPQYSSQSLVLLPPVQASDGGQPTSRDSATEVKVASSDAVLGPAGAKMTPRMSTRAVKKTVEISAPTNDVIQVQAYAGTAAQAEMLARAIADSEVEYLTKSSRSRRSASGTVPSRTASPRSTRRSRRPRPVSRARASTPRTASRWPSSPPSRRTWC